MSRHQKLLLEDEFEFQTVPFLVKVKRRTMYVHAETGEVRGVNVRGAPAGMKDFGEKWTICECVVSTVRPDYPYRIRKEWPENVDKHFRKVVPLEVPTSTRKLLVFTLYEPKHKRDIGQVNIQELAKSTVKEMKNAYENRDEVEQLEASI